MKKIITLAACLLVTTGCAAKTSENIEMLDAGTLSESPITRTLDEQPVQIEPILGDVEEVVLEDVSGGDASGTSYLAFSDGETTHRVIAQGLPELLGGDFYEGWLVRDAAAGDFISTGEMLLLSDGSYELEYTDSKDLTDYTKVVITLEPDDGDPAPAKHIIEN